MMLIRRLDIGVYITRSNWQASGYSAVLIITGETIVSPSDYILLVVFFYSGAVRGLLLDRSPQAI